MNTQLSWLIPAIGGIYLLSIHLLLLLGKHNRLQKFISNCSKPIEELRR